MGTPKLLLTHFTPTMTGDPVFYYVIDQVEDIEILETRLSPEGKCCHCPATHRMGPNRLVCRVRIKPHDTVRWTWFSFLDEECVAKYSQWKLVAEAREAAQRVCEFEEFLEKISKAGSHPLAADCTEKLAVLKHELSFGNRKKYLLRRLIESVGLFPFESPQDPDKVVQKFLTFLSQINDKFEEET